MRIRTSVFASLLTLLIPVGSARGRGRFMRKPGALVLHESQSLRLPDRRGRLTPPTAMPGRGIAPALVHTLAALPAFAAWRSRASHRRFGYQIEGVAAASAGRKVSGGRQRGWAGTIYIQRWLRLSRAVTRRQARTADTRRPRVVRRRHRRKLWITRIDRCMRWRCTQKPS